MTITRGLLLCGLVLALLVCQSLRGDVEEVHYYVRVGDKVPEISSLNDQGKKWTSTAQVGKKVQVLFFYEGDFMPDCTKQARDMEAVHKQLRAEGAEVVGISGDSAEAHRLFRKTNKLTFTLLADYEGTVTYRFGVSRSGGGVRRIKDADGDTIEIRRGVTPGRWTFIIDKEGRVAYKKADVNPTTHAREVLKFVRRLNEQR
jgi:peroxiredoxin Q/BCP